MKRFLTLWAIVFLGLMGTSCDKPVEPEAVLSLATKVVEFSGEAGEQTVALTASGEWSAAPSQGVDWCTVDPLSGNGDASVKVTVTANTLLQRSATIAFKSAGCKDVQLSVIQAVGEAPAPAKTGLYAEPEVPDVDKACEIFYRADKASPFFDFTGSLYAHIGLLVEGEWMFVPAEWNQNLDKCKFQKTQQANLWSLKIAPSVREWFGSGETPLTSIAVVVRNADGSKQTQDLFLKVQDNKYAFNPDEVVKAPLPSGVRHGINYHPDNSVTFVLYDKDKKGESYDYCYLIGDFNQWKREGDYMMKRDDAAGCWWYTLTDVTPGQEHLFQYYIGDRDGNATRLTDPYTEIVYDPWNDPYISSSTYPGLTPYPTQTKGLVSAFEIGRPAYNWKVPDYKIKDQENLVIYEVLIRDFNTTKDLNGLTAKLDYIQNLGVNAIELMPVQEFDGNLSWGYNDNHYFALDKAYGTREMYKQFIDECHSRDIAVLFDVVYNHATGSHPMARMYLSGNAIAPENPWFNVTAPHPYSVFNDWNHENEVVRDHIKRSLEYLLKEYRIDGFRFDLTKGFTQQSSTEATAGNYDASRVKILKDYHRQIAAVNPDAVMILEHFCCLKEEKELAENGMKVWRKMNEPYCQTAMGYQDKSSFEPLYAKDGMPFGSYVGFMESHDEERTAFKAKQFGVASVKQSLELRMQRAALNAAFFLTVPGPKMIWQFGELGYDISIEENGRTGEKPLKWDYLEDPYRKALYEVYAGLLKFRRDYPEFFRPDAKFSWSVSTDAWPQRVISCTAGSRSFVVVGNFGDGQQTFEVDMPAAAKWTDYFDRSQTFDGSHLQLPLKAGEFKMLINF